MADHGTSGHLPALHDTPRRTAHQPAQDSLLPPDPDDPFPRVFRVDRLYAEEKPGTAANLDPPTADEVLGLARPVAMPPLTPGEEEDPPARPLDLKPDPFFDEPAVAASMKNADDVNHKPADKQMKLLRPWDGVNLGK